MQIEQAAQADDLTSDDGLRLGGGYRPLDKAGERATEICFDFDPNDPSQVSLTWDGTVEAASYASRTQSTFQHYARTVTEGDVDFSKIKADASLKTTSYCEKEYEEALFTIAVRVKTAHRQLNTSQVDPGQACETEPRMCDYYASCGSHYVNEEYMGGYMYLNIGTHSLSQTTVDKLEEELGASVASFADARQTLQTARQIIKNEKSAYLSLSVHGPKPPTNLDSNDPPADFIEDVIGYLDTLECGSDRTCDYQSANSTDWGYREAFAACQGTNPDPDCSAFHPAFGAVYNRTMLDYQPTFYEQCTGGHREAGWTCYTEFAEQSSGLRRQYRRMAQEGQWHLDRSGRFDWGDNPSQLQSELAALVGDLQDCNLALSKAQSACHDRANDCEADPTEVCTACTGDNQLIPSSCMDYDELDARFGEIMDTVTYTGGPTPLTTTQGLGTIDLGSTSGNFCWLSSVAGKFMGTGERVRVEADQGSTKWKLFMHSDRTDDGEALRAAAFCRPLAAFTDGTDDLEYSQLYTASATGTSPVNMRDDYYQGALNGIKGAMRGGAENVYIDIDNSKRRLNSLSNQGALLSYGYSFGTPNPSNGVADVLLDSQSIAADTATLGSDSTVRKKLAPIDDGICFLTRVKGKFDGGGERASITHDGANWILELHAGCQDYTGVFGLGDECDQRKPVWATAQCYAYNQQ